MFRINGRSILSQVNAAAKNYPAAPNYYPKLYAPTLEQVVHLRTGKLARYFYPDDRGELKVGKRADVAVMNLDRLEAHKNKSCMSYRAHDLALGARDALKPGWRQSTFESAAYTGSLQGRMISRVL